MRVMSDVRRQAILDVATELFREVGFERASMATISARLGGSKATLYKYFHSKAELFVAAMHAAVEGRGEELVRILDTTAPDPRKVLRRFGKAYLELVSAEDVMAITRTAVAEGTNSGLGPTLYTNGPGRGIQEIAAYLERLQDQGVVLKGDARLMAAQFKALLEAGIVEPLMYGAEREFAISTVVDAAVAAFFRAYGESELLPEG